MNIEDTTLFEAFCFCIVTGVPYGKTWLEMTVKEQQTYLAAKKFRNDKDNGKG